MEYKQGNLSGHQSRPIKVHAIRGDGTALCGRGPEFGWDSTEHKREDVNCKVCQKYLNLIEGKRG